MQLVEIHCSSMLWFYFIVAKTLFGEDIHLITLNYTPFQYVFDSIYNKGRVTYFLQKGVVLLMKDTESAYFLYTRGTECISYINRIQNGGYLGENRMVSIVFTKKLLEFKSEFVCDINATSSTRN
jgi:hypothetical protein